MRSTNNTFMKNVFFRELEALDHRINELLADENRTSNTDSVSRLFYERDRIMQELMLIFNAEKATFTQLNRKDRRIMIGVPNQHAGNVHEDAEYVL